MRTALVIALLALGVGLQLLSCLGLLVMRDTYARLHYLGPATFGVLAIAAAVFVEEPFSMIGEKALLAALFLLATGPVLVHVTARTARSRRHGEWTIRPGEKVERLER
ncbi:MAG TPA: monovalent cation/H(+) antiporter subunit G [Solirubrobacterales bacterium]|nr:monovalent cation/H(+) antiporter subunit G [Solirubrobacterales bacterium]